MYIVIANNINSILSIECRNLKEAGNIVFENIWNKEWLE